MPNPFIISKHYLYHHIKQLTQGLEIRCKEIVNPKCFKTYIKLSHKKHFGGFLYLR